MAMFGKKEEGAPVAPPSGPPTDLVLRMRSQGYSNNQIVQTLQREGYKSHDIFDAMNQADIKGSVVPVQAGQVAQNPTPETPMEMNMEKPALNNQPPSTPYIPEQQQRKPQMPTEAPPSFTPVRTFDDPAGADKEKLEEIAETIIEEKWETLVSDIKKVIEWKERTEGRFVQLEQKFTDLKGNFDQLHSGILGKIGEFDEGLVNVGTEIKALEKVFQKILPTLTENVNELSRITKDIKGSSIVKKK